MYISGDKFSFENRLHEFPANSGDLNQYILEGQQYTQPVYIQEKLNREHNKRLYSLHQVINTGKKY